VPVGDGSARQNLPPLCSGLYLIAGFARVRRAMAYVGTAESEGQLASGGLGLFVLGRDAQKLLEMLAGDDAAPADLGIRQVPAAHLVVEQVARQSGQAGGLVNGIGQPFGSWTRVELTGLAGNWTPGRPGHGLVRIGWMRLARAHGPVTSQPGGLAAGRPGFGDLGER